MRGLLEAIFDTSNSLHEEIFAIRSTDASNLCSRHYLTKTAGELAVQTFIREGWLEKSPNGFITLSERGLLELKGYLMQTYNDMDEGEDEEGGEGGRVDKMRTCHACQEIITKVSPLNSKLTLGSTLCDFTMSGTIPRSLCRQLFHPKK
jgi:non-structural maintenance of chromosomes element 1